MNVADKAFIRGVGGGLVDVKNVRMFEPIISKPIEFK
jgi:hypothetical protein